MRMADDDRRARPRTRDSHESVPGCTMLRTVVVMVPPSGCPLPCSFAAPISPDPRARASGFPSPSVRTTATAPVMRRTVTQVLRIQTETGQMSRMFAVSPHSILTL